jgi:L-ribulose-5-phosphate 4-epimerase
MPSDFRRLRELACRGNLDLAASGLVMGTFGNLSIVDRDAQVFAIKPSGVPYAGLQPDDIVIVSLSDGRPIESRRRPSSDTPTHLELYRAFDACGAVAHTHSPFATILAEARLPVRCMGTTHADYFRGDVPVTRPLSRDEVEGDYERNTGLAIVECFRDAGVSPAEVAGVLVANHGPFTWGADASAAVEHAEMLEYLARLEWHLRAVAPDAPRPDGFLVDRHYRRKHGASAYYGQS